MSDAEPRPALDAEPAVEPDVEPAPAADPEPAPEPEGTAFVQVTRRRAPRYLAFVLTGTALAALVSLVVALVAKPADGYSQQQLFGFLLVSLGVIGAILGGLVAVLVERRR